MNIISFVKNIFKASKPPVQEKPLTDEQIYWRWWSSQDTPEVGGTKHPKFDDEGKKIPGECEMGRVIINNGLDR